MTVPQFPVDAPIVKLIGNTPLVDLSALSTNQRVTIHGKLESANPGGSVKDRPALFIVRAAWSDLARGATLVDATSGNTGIAYALLGRALDFPVHLFMPENASAERKEIFQLLGAKVTLTPGEEGQDGAIDRVRAFADENKEAVYADQYSNHANPRAHFETTGPEILAQTGSRVTHFVAGIGTGGTVTGIGRFLRARLPSVKVIGIEPWEPLHGLEGLKHLATSHRPAILDEAVVHEHRFVPTLDAWETSRLMLDWLALPVGPSSGAALAACRRLAKELDQGHIVTVLPDGYNRYRSTLYGEFMRKQAGSKQ